MTVSNGSLCDCQCGNRLYSTCPTWLQLTAEIHLPALHKMHGLHLVEAKKKSLTSLQSCYLFCEAIPCHEVLRAKSLFSMLAC